MNKFNTSWVAKLRVMMTGFVTAASFLFLANILILSKPVAAITVNLCKYPAITITDANGNEKVEVQEKVVQCPPPAAGFDINPEKCYEISSNGEPNEVDCSLLQAVGAVPDGKTPTATGSAVTGSDELDNWLQAIINLLSGVIGLVFVLSFIFAGFQYMTARDNASQVAAAKDRVLNLVLAFVVFVFGFALLQWLVPGGIF